MIPIAPFMLRYITIFSVFYVERN